MRNVRLALWRPSQHAIEDFFYLISGHDPFYIISFRRNTTYCLTMWQTKSKFTSAKQAEIDKRRIAAKVRARHVAASMTRTPF